MRVTTILVLLFLSPIIISAQDGSNMKYLKPSELNQSHIGKFAHLDFGRRSFAAFERVRGKDRPLDTVTIEVNGKNVTFREHRIDDGFNNWFKDQYLEAEESIDGLRLRLTKSEILRLNEESILVRAFFVFFDSKAIEVSKRSFTKELTFLKKELAEILIKAS